MVWTRSTTPEADRAAEIFHSLQREREATVAVPGTQNARLLGRLADGVIAGVGLYFVSSAVYALNGAGRTSTPTEPEIHVGPGALDATFLQAFVLVVGMFVVYEVLSTAWRGATFGKKRTQLQIVDATSFQPVAPDRLLLRTLLWAVPVTFVALTWFYSMLFAWGGVALLAGMYFWRFRDDSGGRPLWDVLAGTQVITTDFEGR